MSSEDGVPHVEKRAPPCDGQPPLKRLKEDAVEDDEGEQTSVTRPMKQMLPTVKKSENHGITEYVSKAHDGFFGECLRVLKGIAY